MLEFSSIEAEILSRDVIRVSWAIAPTDEDLALYRFTVGRSNSPEGPFDQISEELLNTFTYFDNSRQRISKHRKVYYQITVTKTATGETAVSDVADLDTKADYFLLEIRRRHNLYLRRYVGIPAAVLICKTFGQRCHECFDWVKQRRRKSKCKICFDTGFVGGYFPQVNAMVNFSPEPEILQIADFGERQPSQSNMWMTNYPELSPRDIILEFPQRKRWRVITVGRTERLRATSRQVVSVAQVNPDDIQYELEVQEFVPPADDFIGFRPPNGSGLL